MTSYVRGLGKTRALPLRMATLPLAAALALAAAIPGFAVGGLPRLSDLQAGPYSVALYNDSPTLVAGRNVVTLEVPREAADQGVQLALLSADGRSLPVRLRAVSILGNAADSEHGSANDSGGSGHESPGATEHSAAATGHESSVTSDHSAPSAEAGAGTQATNARVSLRGKVNVPSAGAWRARVTVTDPAGEVHLAEAVLEAAPGGPSRLYLLATVSIVAGALSFGIVARRYAVAQSLRRGGSRQ